MKIWSLLPIVFCVLTFASCSKAGSPNVPAGFTAKRDLSYVEGNNPRQTLDLYLPEQTSLQPRPLVVFIHGGGWEEGTKDAGVELIFPLIQDGTFAGASIAYRLTNEAQWPAQIFDCKAAIRWLKAHAKEYNFDPERIALFGISAGGHLASLLGTSADVSEVEGTLGKHLDQSTRVKAVINFCGPENFLTIDQHPSLIGFNDPNSCVGKLFGGALPEKKTEARMASPITHIDKDDPPFITIHGTKDELVPYPQATEFHAALQKANVESHLVTGVGGGHVFLHPEITKRERQFLENTLLGKKNEIPTEPVEISSNFPGQ